MWVVNNQTPFAAERCWVRDKRGAEVWLVAVKGTFNIMPDGTLMIAEEQLPVIMAPEFSGDPLSSSLKNDTDLPHLKLATDVLVEGHAYAPEGKPVKNVLVGLRVGKLKKILSVTGDRYWKPSATGAKPSTPKPFTKMPITYERAYGGMDKTSDSPEEHEWDVRNPAGCGFNIKPEHIYGRPVPNIEYPNNKISSAMRKGTPAGFGPVAGHWSPRRELAGTYDEQWEKNRQPLLPEDFNELYYQSAPEDQQVSGYLKGGETIDLANLTLDGRLSFKLPRFSFSFTTYFDDGSSESHRAVLHTVQIKSDLPQVVLIWHTHLECHQKVLKLNRTTVRLKNRIMLAQYERELETVE